ncbi:MAG: hypothetical protein V9G14_10400 [Cypionkella sp.]
MFAAIGIMLVLSLSTAGMLRMVGGLSEVNGDLAIGRQRLRAADSAMIEVAQAIRSAVGADAKVACPPGGASHTYTQNVSLSDGKGVTVSVVCSGTVTASATREIVLTATLDGGAKPMGRARIEYLDVIGALPSPGYGMNICDWSLGVDGSTTPAACP